MKEHKESGHQRTHADWLSPAEQDLLGGEIGVYDAKFISILQKMQEEGQITSWRRSPDYSLDDGEGKDYWVRVKGNEIPLGITSTLRKAQERRVKHPDVPSLYLRNKYTTGFKEEKVIKRQILGAIWSYLNR